MSTKQYTPPKRFAGGTRVHIKNPGIDGIVTFMGDERGALGEYWHVVKTAHQDKTEPGCNLELIPEPLGGRKAESRLITRDIHFHGANSRVNIDSIDLSNNSGVVERDHLFVQLREQAQTLPDESAREEVLSRIDDMEAARNSGGFIESYKAFMSVASDHIPHNCVCRPHTGTVAFALG